MKKIIYGAENLKIIKNYVQEQEKEYIIFKLRRTIVSNAHFFDRFFGWVESQKVAIFHNGLIEQNIPIKRWWGRA